MRILLPLLCLYVLSILFLAMGWPMLFLGLLFLGSLFLGVHWQLYLLEKDPSIAQIRRSNLLFFVGVVVCGLATEFIPIAAISMVFAHLTGVGMGLIVLNWMHERSM